MLEQASLRVHYGELAAKASKQVDDAKMLLEVTESKVDRRIRDELAAKGEKSTEPSIARAVATHERVIGMRRALNEARQIEALAKAALEAFRDRKDMLVQLGAKDRTELEGELRISARALGDEVSSERRRQLLEKMAGKSEVPAAA